MTDSSARHPRVMAKLGDSERDAEWTLPSGTRFKSEDGYWWALPPGESEWKRSSHRGAALTERRGSGFTEVLVSGDA